jgi:crotonobetainyl-CoA:carnitine CoA-transferase CaiB-like acyl-CoA transferase
MAGALEGIRVIDFGQYIAGPLAAMLLADQGAEVIHVDPPGGNRWRHLANATLNRGKTLVELDLKDAAGREQARRLIDTADVVIENFRPGVMRRLGLAWDVVRGTNERLIYCSIPAFAEDDPRAQMPGWEGIVAAATGLCPTGASRRAPGAEEPLNSDTPRFTALPLASEYGALAAAIGITMALIARERDGLGQRIEIPLFDAMFLCIGSNGLLVNGGPSGSRPRDPWAGAFPANGDSRLLLALAKPHFLRTFLDIAGKAEEWEDKGYFAPDVASDREMMARIREDMAAVFMSRTAEEWDRLANEAGLPLSIIRTSRDWMATKHAREAGIFLPVNDPEYGEMLQPGPSVKLNGTPGSVRPRPTALSSIESLLHRDAAVAQPSATPVSAPLAGFRVVDTTAVLAGPTAGRTLAEFGAEVIQVHNPWEEGSGYRWQVHRYHTDVNRGKKSILVDLKNPGGLELLWRLVDRADVFLQNMRLSVAERLGIGYEQVRQHKPDIVYLSISAYGYGGEWEHRPGYEPVAQSLSGMLARGPQVYPLNDYGTGLLGAFGVGLALFHRLRSGEGQSVETSLAQSATYLQIPYMQTYAGKTWDEPQGPDARGWSPLQRLYRASDGWFFLGAAASQKERLKEIPELADAADKEGDALVVALEGAFATKPVAEWVAMLTAAGIGAYVVGTTAPELMKDPWVVEHGLSVTQTSKDGSQITTIGPPWRMSRTPPSVRHLVSPPGGDAFEVVSEAGLADRFEELVRQKAVVLD